LGASDNALNAELDGPAIVQSSTFFHQGFNREFEGFKEADLGWFGFSVETVLDV